MNINPGLLSDETDKSSTIGMRNREQKVRCMIKLWSLESNCLPLMKLLFYVMSHRKEATTRFTLRWEPGVKTENCVIESRSLSQSDLNSFFLCDGYMFVHPRMVEIQIQRGQSKEEMSTRRALWLRVVPWDGTVSLWWRSVHNPRPSFTIFQLISHQVPHICYVLANGQVDWWTCSNPWRSLKLYIIHFIFVGCLFDWLKCWF